jgi:hypothetical protein
MYGFLQIRQWAVCVEASGISAPVVLQIVDAPLRPRARVLLFVLIAGRESLTGRCTRPGVNPGLEAFAMDVIHQAFHVGELFVGQNLAVGVTALCRVIAAGPTVWIGRHAPAGLPGIVDVDVGVALRREDRWTRCRQRPL